MRLFLCKFLKKLIVTSRNREKCDKICKYNDIELDCIAFSQILNLKPLTSKASKFEIFRALKLKLLKYVRKMNLKSLNLKCFKNKNFKLKHFKSEINKSYAQF